MSRLIDKLNKISKTVPQPLGFTSARPVQSKPPMLFIASLTPSENIDSLASYVSDADAVLFDFTKSSPSSKALKRITQALPDTPWGGWLSDVSAETIALLVKAGSDFVVFPVESAVSATYQNENLGKILQLAPSLSADLLRMANELAVGAVLAAPAAENILTWRQLMFFQRLANLVDKPLIAPVPPNLTPNELKPLWEAGVDSIIIEVGPEYPEGKLKELKQALEDSTFLPTRKRRKAEALLPRLSEEPEPVIDEGEEDEP